MLCTTRASKSEGLASKSSEIIVSIDGLSPSRDSKEDEDPKIES